MSFFEFTFSILISLVFFVVSGLFAAYEEFGQSEFKKEKEKAKKNLKNSHILALTGLSFVILDFCIKLYYKFNSRTKVDTVKVAVTAPATATATAAYTTTDITTNT
jgi:hypothetical protein